MKIEVIQPKFDMDAYKYQALVAIKTDMPTDRKVLKISLLIQKAYEQGLVEGGKDEDWYEQ